MYAKKKVAFNSEKLMFVKKIFKAKLYIQLIFWFYSLSKLLIYSQSRVKNGPLKYISNFQL